MTGLKVGLERRGRVRVTGPTKKGGTRQSVRIKGIDSNVLRTITRKWTPTTSCGKDSSGKWKSRPLRSYLSFFPLQTSGRRKLSQTKSEKMSNRLFRPVLFLLVESSNNPLDSCTVCRLGSNCGRCLLSLSIPGRECQISRSTWGRSSFSSPGKVSLGTISPLHLRLQSKPPRPRTHT